MVHPSVDEGRLLLVNKPIGWTSSDVVKKLRNGLNINKIGHAGTLDPLATGLLILCTGKMTKQIDAYQAQEKEYTGTCDMGYTTPSYDLESEPTPLVSIDHLTDTHVQEAAVEWTGNIQQLPPMYSAVKMQGKRLYELARKGEEVQREARSVEVKLFELERIQAASFRFRVVCSKGTYIRSLIHDLGQTLGVGACMTSLCRTRIGEYRLEDALTIEELLYKSKV